MKAVPAWYHEIADLLLGSSASLGARNGKATGAIGALSPV